MIAAKVRFAPGARTAWHSHARGQILHVTQGIAWVRSRGGEKVELHAGQTVYCPPGEEHWHGAAPDSFMSIWRCWKTPMTRAPPRPGSSQSLTPTTSPDHPGDGAISRR